MENLVKLYKGVLEKLNSKKLGIHFYWKVTVVGFCSLIILSVIGGWTLYIYTTTNLSLQLPVKINRSELTIGDIEKVKEITENKQNKLNEIIKSDVNIQPLR